ncbi:MAG: hypothetical protein K6A63_01345 [Acholeplasmatales bacterium]|nr:hypothetical protein [Acholeplasmatales bacterium]
MEQLHDLFQETVNSTFDEKVEMGKSALKDIVEILAAHDLDKDDVSSIVLALVMLFTGADGELSEQEHMLLNEIVDAYLNPEELYELMQDGSEPEFIESIKRVVLSLSLEERMPFVIFGLSILTSDDELTVQEQELFINLCTENN